MGGRRKLTDEEKRMIRERVLEDARKANPDAMVQVQVDDYVDENGRVGHKTTIIKESPLG